MAREVRVLAEPDFPVIIFVEFQTNNMSADGINDMATQAPKKIPQTEKPAHPKFESSPKRFGGESEGNLSSEKVPLRNNQNKILSAYHQPLLSE